MKSIVSKRKMIIRNDETGRILHSQTIGVLPNYDESDIEDIFLIICADNDISIHNADWTLEEVTANA